MRKLFILFLLPLLLTACDSQNTIYSYADVKGKHLTYENIFLPTNPHYFIYVYSGGCYVCASIKQDIINYSLKHENFYFLLYCHEFVPTSEDFDQSSILGASKNSEVYLIGTPTMLEIKEGKISEYYLGMEKILTKLGIFLI